jgi:hypothetical protein
MNSAPANAARQVNLVPALPMACQLAANDDIEGIEVTYLEVEEIELETANVPAWRPV